MGAMEQINGEGDETDSSNKVEGVLVNTMHRAASVDDLFAPLWSLNVHANGESQHSSSSVSAARPSLDRPVSQSWNASLAAPPSTTTHMAVPSSPAPSAHIVAASVEEQRKGISGGLPKLPLPTGHASGHASVPSSALEAEGSHPEAEADVVSEKSLQQQGASERAPEAPCATRASSSPRSSSQFSEVDGADVKPSLFSSEPKPVPAYTSGVKCSLSTGRSNSSGGGADPALPPSQSTSDDDQQNGLCLDERKQKRMLSNRESARRSRLRKQQHLDELRAQVAQLRAENTEMMARFSMASHRFSQITGENGVLRAHAVDLSRKLQQVYHMVATQHPNGLRALGIQPGHLDQFSSDHLSPYYQPLVPDLLP